MATTIPKTLTRTFALEVLESDRETSTFSFSSEFPVDRGWGKEILVHSPDSVDLGRLQTGNLLFDHDRRQILGAVERAWIDQGKKKGYCEVRWSSRPEALAYKRDVDDGILKNVSFGYNVIEVQGQNPLGEYRVTKWEPFEVSIVSVPADPSVGFGRSGGFEGTIAVEFRGKEMTALSEEQLQEIKDQAIAEDLERQREIRSMCARYNLPKLAERAISERQPVQWVKDQILEEVGKRQMPVAGGAIDPVKLDLDEKERKQYSLLRAIDAASRNDWSKAGFELECSRAMAERIDKDTNGFYIPTGDLLFPKTQQRATYAVGAAATGGNLVETTLQAESFIDALRNRLVIRALGATVLSGLQGNVDIPGQDGVTTTYWVAEDSDLTQSEATTRLVNLRPKVVGALSKMTRLMIQQSSIDMEQFVRNDFVAVIAREIDRAAIAGSGTSNQPRGILNLSGVNSVAIGTNGGAPTYATIIQMLSELEVDNADIGRISWLTNPRVKAKLMLTPKQGSGVEGNFILQGDGMNLLGYNMAMTNAVPSNLTKGSGSNLSALIFGNFEDLIIGEWGVVEMLPNPYGAGYAAGSIQMRVLQTVDIAFRRAVSFVVCSDLVTTL